MKVIKQRLDHEQKEYEKNKRQLEDKCKAEIIKLETNLTIDTVNLLDTHVNNVLSKVI
jgi:hypothetical protein